MARPTRLAPDPVALQASLHAHPEDYEFFAALRWLECAHPERPRLGESTKPSEDVVRLRQTPSLAFAPRMIDRYEPPSAERPAQLHGFFFGLFGPHGALPLHLTEYAIDRRLNARDSTFSAFADIFHHRMLSLFYRAWADAQPTVQADRGNEDRFHRYTGALVGLAGAHMQHRDALPDAYKRFFAGRLLGPARNAEGLRCLLEHFLRIPVQVVEFVAEWMRLPASAHLRMGSSPEVAGLGLTAVMGSHVRGAQQRFRLRMGPLERSDFNKLLPGGAALAQVVAAVKTYLGEEKAWDVQLVLRRAEVPTTRLGLAGRMGLTTWMGRLVDPGDPDDVVFQPIATPSPAQAA